MNLAIAQIEINVVVRQHTGKSLDDPPHLNGISDFGHGCLWEK
jgi:hypothetical protein